MKWLMLLLAIPMLCSAQVKKLTADEIKELMDKKDVFYLDVREPKELQDEGLIKGAVNIPLGQLEARLSEVPKDKLIISGCRSGARAQKAAAILEKNGYKVAGACGLNDWKEKQYPVVYPPKQ